MQALVLSANFEAWKSLNSWKFKSDFQRFSEKVFIRDNYTCQFCGFQAKEYQEIIDIEQQYKKFDLETVVTACCFCAQCFFLESVGVGSFGGGTLIYLPEISQVDLNSFCHVIFCTIANNTDHKSSAETMYRSLKFRYQQIEEQFGEGSSEPSIFGQLLIESNTLKNSTIQEIINKNIRLLPSRARFKTQIEQWAKNSTTELEENPD